MSMYYRYGEAAALRDLGLEKAATEVPAAVAEGAAKAPGLVQRAMSRLGNTKVPLKVLGGIGAVAGGAYLANKAMSDPHVEVHPTLPMRTMYS
jgi:hypothetical protein